MRRRWRSSQVVSLRELLADHHASVALRVGRVASRRMQRLGAIPIDDEQVEFRVWAPNARSRSRSASAATSTRSRATTTGPGPATCPRGPATTTVFVVDGDALARPVLALPARGRARPVAGRRHARASTSRRGRQLDARGARPLRAARRHVLAARARSTASIPRLRAPARARHHGDRADAGRDVSRATATGATTASTPSRRTAPTAARTGSRASSTPRTARASA